MPLTRSKRQSLEAAAADLFEPSEPYGARPTTRRPREKRSAAEPEQQQTKKKRTSVHRKVSRAAASKTNDEPTAAVSLAKDWQSDSTASAVIATVTPSTARVRRQHSHDVRPRMPDDVVDIFDANLGEELTSSIWETSEKLMHNYITGFMHTYGREYYEELYKQDSRECTAAKHKLRMKGDWRFRFPQSPISFDTLLPYQPLLNMKMRHVLVAWMAEVVAEFKLSQAAYHLAVSMLDELLLMGPTLEKYKEAQKYASSGAISDDEAEDEYFLIKPRNFQAIGCTCIWIASKIEDRTPPSSEQLSFISDNACSADCLLEFEARIMELFKFRPLKVTPVHFFDINQRASHASTADYSLKDIKKSNPKFHHMMQYLLQLGRPMYQLRLEKTSLFAAAACYLTRAILGLRAEDGSIWTPTLTHYAGHEIEALARPVALLLCSYMEAEHLNKPLFTIYKSQERCRVSLMTAPLLETLSFGYMEDVCKHDDIVAMIDERKKMFHDEV